MQAMSGKLDLKAKKLQQVQPSVKPTKRRFTYSTVLVGGRRLRHVDRDFAATTRDASKSGHDFVFDVRSRECTQSNTTKHKAKEAP